MHDQLESVVERGERPIEKPIWSYQSGRSVPLGGQSSDVTVYLRGDPVLQFGAATERLDAMEPVRVSDGESLDTVPH